MKALLFALLLVAFMCEDPDPVAGLQCLRCYGACKEEICLEDQPVCYTLDNGVEQAVRRGCAPTCPQGDNGLEAKCCTTNFCNE
ncbi:three-fingered toxin-20 [Crotalus adamanteus]|uniref:Three-fingered toxin-20 n=1 Tax=Crotalus adamanteus TaxID=8729 RepID=A0AAW1BLH3_CROAD